jgi:tetratricopeptide (TPR) repeat protein
MLVICLLCAGQSDALSQIRWEKGKTYPNCPSHPPVISEVLYRIGWYLEERGYNKKISRILDTTLMQQSLWFYSKAIKSYPSSHIAYGSRGLTHFRLGEVDHALADYQKALTLCPEDAWTLSNMGYIYFLRNDLVMAEEVYRKAVSSDAQFTDARRNLGVILALQKHFSEAIDEWKTGLVFDPSNSILIFYIGSAYKDLEMPDEAKIWLEKAYDLNPSLRN